MPRWPPIHPDLIVAIRVLDADGMPYAELWRQMRGVARNLGIRCPTYWMVRRSRSSSASGRPSGCLRSGS